MPYTDRDDAVWREIRAISSGKDYDLSPSFVFLHHAMGLHNFVQTEDLPCLNAQRAGLNLLGEVIQEFKSVMIFPTMGL